ncbi:MAG: hypothetical protein ACHQ50_02000 [Fimbriimonadales bacterium]
MKLSGWTIIVIGVCLGLSAICYSYFQVYAPSEDAAQYMRDYKANLETQAGKQKKAEDRVRKAQKLVQIAADKWNVYVAKFTPSDSLAANGINVFENPFQLVVDSPKYRNNAQRAFNAQLHAGGVTILSAQDIPPPTDSEKDILASYYNYPAFLFPVVLWELGPVTVKGTYAQICQNVRSWTNMPHYLAVVDGLRFDGTSPILTATYNVTIVGFIRSRAIFPAPSATTSTGSSGGAGGGGGAAGVTGAPVGGGAGGNGISTPPGFRKKGGLAPKSANVG